MPLGPILGREPRNSGGSVLIAELYDRGAEHVADSPYGANQRGTVGPIVKFLPESRDQRIDRPIEICPLAPAQHAEKGRARQGLAGVAQKRHQEVELGRRQVDPLPSGTHEVSRRLVEDPTRERVEPLDRLDRLGAANLELATPWGALDCSLANPRVQVLCDGMTWNPIGECSGQLVCDTSSGPDQGLCTAPDRGISDAGSGD